MTITRTQNDKALFLALEGRLDTTTAPELDKELKGSIEAADSLTLDLTKLEYISSAGLRVLLWAHNAMSGKSGMKLIGANEIVKEVFDVTGLSDVLTIE
ncbi:MAG: STAS domain-containing protein [Clostridiales bacterium]|nr:STAS domain-containing protein [Clostridiales bacterium]